MVRSFFMSIWSIKHSTDVFHVIHTHSWSFKDSAEPKHINCTLNWQQSWLKFSIRTRLHLYTKLIRWASGSYLVVVNTAYTIGLLSSLLGRRKTSSATQTHIHVDITEHFYNAKKTRWISSMRMWERTEWESLVCLIIFKHNFYICHKTTIVNFKHTVIRFVCVWIQEVKISWDFV